MIRNTRNHNPALLVPNQPNQHDDDHHGVRRSKRRRSTGFHSSGSATMTPETQPRYRAFNFGSVDEITCCIQWGFMKSFCCAGCSTFATAPSVDLNIDDRDHDALMVTALEKRKNWKTPKYHCTAPWKHPPEYFDTEMQASTAIQQQQFIRNVRKIDPRRLMASTVTPATIRQLDYGVRTRSTGPILPTPQNMPDTPQVKVKVDHGATAAATLPNPMEIDVITSPSKNKIRNVNLHTQSFHSQKQHFCFDIPVSHRIVHGKYLTELEKDREALHQLRDGTWLQRFAKSANSKLKTYLAVALAAAPALAVTAAGYFIPMVVTAFLHHYGLFETTVYLVKLESWRTTPSHSLPRPIHANASLRPLRRI